MNITFETRIYAVESYFKKGVSLREASRSFKIPYQTIHRWVKWYREGGEENLKRRRPYIKPWNKAKTALEQKVVLLKEKKPSVTVRMAKQILKKKGIILSLKGIWGIWRRYGYAGFKRQSMSNEFTEYCPWTKEARSKLTQAKMIFELGKIRESAEILNSIPFLPKNDFILKIPDHYLNIRRRVERIPSLFGKIPLKLYLEKTRSLHEECRRQNFHYSSLRVGIMELVALSWRGTLGEQLRKTEELKRSIKKTQNNYSYLLFEPRFSLLISEGSVYAHLLEVKKGVDIARICVGFLKRRKHPSPYLMIDLGVLYMNLEDYRSAEYWFTKSLNSVDEKTNKALKGKLARIFFLKGAYRKAIRLSREAEFGEWASLALRSLFQANLFLLKGMPQKAILYSTNSLSQFRKEETIPFVLNASFIIASAYCSIGETVKARGVLQRVFSIISKNKIKRWEAIIEILLNRYRSRGSEENILPTAKLALLIKDGKYFKAISYAKKKGILSYFYRYTFFFPEVIINYLEKGKPTEIPKAILRLPVFNKDVAVYNIRFLGDLIVYKNQNYLKAKLQPKDVAILIHLALKAGEPKKGIFLEDLYRNFWKNSTNPSKNLSHLLVRIKKTINISFHLLEISYKKDNPVLINEGIHFITDYGDIQQAFAQANVLERTGEWEFAKKEYLRAFALFRGEPFRKMYDPWSEHMRRVILNNLETEAMHFAKSCLEHNNKVDAKKVLEKVSRIIPGSEEIGKMVNEY